MTLSLFVFITPARRAAVRAALAACSTPGAAPCRVLLAKSYASGPLRINSSDTELHITGTRSMLTRDRYPKTPADQRAYGDFITNAPGVQRLQIRGSSLL